MEPIPESLLRKKIREGGKSNRLIKSDGVPFHLHTQTHTGAHIQIHTNAQAPIHALVYAHARIINMYIHGTHTFPSFPSNHVLLLLRLQCGLHLGLPCGCTGPGTSVTFSTISRKLTGGT